ncbi:MAG: chemotaxis protein CheD [Myxococcales bacterium]|nr:chemotaxis protein CheD [Myxococcales bacterium]
MSKLRTMLDAGRPRTAKTRERPRRDAPGADGTGRIAQRPGPRSKVGQTGRVAQRPQPNAGQTARRVQRVRSPQSAVARQDLTVVGISDLVVLATSGQLVTYALGSCVGVVGYDQDSRVAGLLHVLLPQSKTDKARAAQRPATFADTGVPALVRAMQALGANPQTSRFRLAGGASMLSTSKMLEIGRRNVLAVRKAIWKAGLLVEGEAVGGSQPRTMSVDLGTGIVTVSSPGRPEIAL